MIGWVLGNQVTCNREERAFSELVFSMVKKSGLAKPWHTNSVSRSRIVVLSSMLRGAWDRIVYYV